MLGGDRGHARLRAVCEALRQLHGPHAPTLAAQRSMSRPLTRRRRCVDESEDAIDDRAEPTRIPSALHPVLTAHAGILSGTLGDALVGVYVHGSAAIGGFDFARSDVDYIAVVDAPLDDRQRRLLGERFLAVFGENCPGNGVEMHVVESAYTGAGFVHPTPAAFHFGTREQIERFSEPGSRPVLDPDLAAHFTVVRHRGVRILGQPSGRVFAGVPEACFLDSIRLDCEECHESILKRTPPDRECRVPPYAVLNLCRTCACLETGRILSKREGGRWALDGLPDRHRPVVRAALEESGCPDPERYVPGTALRAFSTYAIARIDRGVRGRDLGPLDGLPALP